MGVIGCPARIAERGVKLQMLCKVKTVSEIERNIVVQRCPEAGQKLPGETSFLTIEDLGTPDRLIDAVDLINKVKDVAEEQDHHPDIHLTGYKKLQIDLSTHAIGGLSKNDFIVAAKVNELLD